MKGAIAHGRGFAARVPGPCLLSARARPSRALAAYELGGGRRRLALRALGVAVVDAEPLAAVAAHVVDQRSQSLALRRQRVLHARGHFGIGVALDDALLLERPQAQREGAGADPRQRALELAEAGTAVGEVPDHEHRPLAADDVRRSAHGAAWITHNSDSSAMLYELKLWDSAAEVAQQAARPAGAAAPRADGDPALARLHEHPAVPLEGHLDRLPRGPPDEVLQFYVGLDAGRQAARPGDRGLWVGKGRGVARVQQPRRAVRDDRQPAAALQRHVEE